MAVGHFTLQRCPRCQHVIDSYVYFCTRLGPTSLVCPKCEARVATGRAEWADFTAGMRVRYVVLSVVDAVAVAFFASVSALFAVSFLQNGPSATKVPPRAPEMFAGAVVGVALVVALQIHRVRASLRRTATPTRQPDRPRFGNLVYKLQFKLLGAVFGVAIVAWLASFVIHG